MDDQTERFLNLRKKIWDNITEDELHEIKQYLQIKYKKQFGRASLQKVTNCVDLIRLLQDRDLLGINKLSFIKTLLDHMKRNDLLREVNNYDKESAEAVDAKSRRPKSDSTCEDCHLQQSIKIKNIEIQQNVEHQTNVSNTLEKLKENMEEQTQIISSNKMRLTRIELEKKQKLENERKCRDEQVKIEAKIKQLQEEKREESDLERSLLDDIDRMSREHREVEYLISEAKYKKNELSKRYEDEFRKEKEFSQTVNNLELELHTLKLQINQRSEIHQYQPRNRPNSNNNGSYSDSESINDVTTDAQPTERANTINKEYRRQHEPSPSRYNTDPTCNVVIIISAEENAEQSSSFQDDLREIQGEGTLICESIVVREQLTEEFLNVTNDKIPQAKLVFMLFSKAFVKNCWPEICKMKNFNSAIYDNKPLIIPVSAETNTEFPMGMKSAHNLSFHRRDSYYKEALKKLVRPYIR